MLYLIVEEGRHIRNTIFIFEKISKVIENKNSISVLKQRLYGYHLFLRMFGKTKKQLFHNFDSAQKARKFSLTLWGPIPEYYGFQIRYTKKSLKTNELKIIFRHLFEFEPKQQLNQSD